MPKAHNFHINPNQEVGAAADILNGLHPRAADMGQPAFHMKLVIQHPDDVLPYDGYLGPFPALAEE
mgnify:CR=1 FL=1